MIIACSDSRVDPTRVFDTDARPELCVAQCRQSGAALSSPTAPSTALRRRSNMPSGDPEGASYRRFRPCPLRRHRGLARRPVRRCCAWFGRLHRQLDVDDRPGAGPHPRGGRHCLPTSMPPARWNSRRSASASPICAASPLSPKPKPRGNCRSRAPASISPTGSCACLTAKPAALRQRRYPTGSP